MLRALAPDGPVYQAGTLSGNPLATAAGLAVLDAVTPADYEALSSNARRLATGLERAILEAGIPVQVPVVGPLVGLFFGADPVTDYASARATGDRWRVPPILLGHARPGRGSGAGPLRGDVPGARPSRGPSRRRGGGGCGGGLRGGTRARVGGLIPPRSGAPRRLPFD